MLGLRVVLLGPAMALALTPSAIVSEAKYFDLARVAMYSGKSLSESSAAGGDT